MENEYFTAALALALNITRPCALGPINMHVLPTTLQLGFNMQYTDLLVV